MVLQRLTARRSRALLVVPLSLLVAAGCSSGGGNTKDAAAKAKAACQVFAGFHPPTGSSQTAQINYTKESYVGFLKAADLSRKAAAEDSRWSALQTAAQREAAAFEVIVKASDPKASGDVSAASVKRAVDQSNAARPAFVAECDKADPGGLEQGGATPSPTAS